MAPNTNDMVVFNMPDGTKVSNDPRFDRQKAVQEALKSTPNKGDAGITHEEQVAQTQVEHPASLNSGQPGVGENPAPEDPTEDLHGPLGSPAQISQREDAKKAKEEGASPRNTSVKDPTPVDSNEAVKAVRAKAAKRHAAAQESLKEAGEEEGDPNQPYSEWSAKQLKAEVAKRNADGRSEEEMIDTKGVTKKSELAELLEADDEE